MSGCCAAVLFFCAAAAIADVIVVKEQSQAAIQSALDRVTPPGTVILPSGRYEINSSLQVRTGDLTVQGSGTDSGGQWLTVLFRTRDGTSSALIQSIGYPQVRITGIRFEGVTSRDSTGREVGVAMENAVDFRIDHCFFARTAFAGVKVSAASSGVVDHCEFEDLYKDLLPSQRNAGYGVDVDGTHELLGEPFGSGRATFIENSSFRRCRHAVASNGGARYVFRYNYVSQNQVAHAVDAHGQEEGQPFPGTEWADVHHNLIQDPVSDSTRWAVRIRGGMGLVWRNIITGYDVGVTLTQDTPQVTGPIYIWENEVVARVGGKPPLRCRDQPTLPLVCADGTQGLPTFELSLPPDYVPFPYPHPLASP